MSVIRSWAKFDEGGMSMKCGWCNKDVETVLHDCPAIPKSPETMEEVGEILLDFEVRLRVLEAAPSSTNG